MFAAALEHAREGSDNSLRDVVALSTLPAIWTGAEPLRIAESLAAALFTMLNPEFVFVSFVLTDSFPQVAIAQTGRYENDRTLAQQIGPTVLDWVARARPRRSSLARTTWASKRGARGYAPNRTERRTRCCRGGICRGISSPPD